jgi:3-hydroxyacyl-[acyl-carrier-protein] dehydratase
MTNEILCVHSTHPALPGHFPGNPLVPGVVLLAKVIDAAERLHEGKQRVAGISAVKFHAPVHPDKAVMLSLAPVSPVLLKFECRTGKTLIATGSLELAATRP